MLQIKWTLFEQDLFGSSKYYARLGDIRLEKEVIMVGEKVYKITFAIGSIENSLIKFDSELGLVKYLTI
jgi:hypothetical protein